MAILQVESFPDSTVTRGEDLEEIDRGKLRELQQPGRHRQHCYRLCYS